MSSLKANFSELMLRIRQGRSLGHAGFEPIYYLVFAPSEILEVKRSLPGWQAQLQMDGWEVYRFSLAEEIAQIIQAAPTYNIWLRADRKALQAEQDMRTAWDKTNQALANAVAGGALQGRLEARLAGLKDVPNALLLVTDLEALHPYLRIGTIEGQLSGKFCVPTVFLYPGVRTGKTKLSFLGFYPEDGSYRSVHIGG
ncbi:MAG: BREX protein BrxB domain-containing protein [Caldilineaceae bacterium]